ncbi:MAG: APC family permease [Sphingomonadales bacterium]|nr:MAG: APC family permease [Sphingomonadales bacterium]TNF03176.1 MAG: APC family permease [Sphingomonadales bacterium]
MKVEAGNSETHLERRSIDVTHIVFFVVAAAAPLTAVVGATPPAFALGNGAGVAGAFLLAGSLYLLFSAGFTAMSHHVGSAGGFYSYLAQGLSRPIGLGGATVMLLTYSAIQIGIYSLFGVFLSDALAGWGVNLPWWAGSLGAIATVLICGRRSIAFSGNLLGLCMIGEILILLLLDIAILVNGGGPQGLSLFPTLSPATIFSPGLGVALVFVIGSYVGFEATAIFAEEARNPHRTIPRATYIAVLLITGFYAFSTWTITQYYGPSAVSAAATADLENFYFGPTRLLLGNWAVGVMQILLIISLFACVLSLHNAINRYLFALGRDGVLPSFLSSLHPRHHSPAMAGLVQTLSALAILVTFILSGASPYKVIFPWMSALGVCGVLFVQTVTCLAVIFFFRADHHGYGLFRRLIAPALSAMGLATMIVLVIKNIHLLTGAQNPFILALPWLITLIAGIGGTLYALWLSVRRPEIYARLGRSFE